MPAVPLSTTDKQLALTKPQRKAITFTNPDTIAIFYIRSPLLNNLPTSTTNYDYIVGPGIALNISILTDDPVIVRGSWFAISDTVTKTIGVAET